MATFMSIIKFLGLLRDFLAFVDNEITEAEFMNRVRKMKEAATRASTGDLDDRLGGGRDVEDQLNRRHDDSN